VSRAGLVRDPTAEASLFSQLKTERIVPKVYQKRKPVPADGFDHVERFYNSTRGHLTLGCVKPIHFDDALIAEVSVHGTGISQRKTLILVP